MTYKQAENAEIGNHIANVLGRRAIKALHQIDEIYDTPSLDNDEVIDKILDIIDEFKACDEFEEE